MLRECPFCGASADVFRTEGRYGWFVFVRCSFCGAQTATKKAEAFENEEDFWAQRAVLNVERLWNTRHQP